MTMRSPGAGTSLRVGVAAAVVAVAAFANAPAASAQPAAHVRSGAPASPAGSRFPATFIAVAAVTPTRLAVFSAVDGHRVKFLTTPQPGGGVNAPVLSANGRTVAFERGLGSCRVQIDTVPATGGRERVLVPLVSSSKQTTIAFAPSLSTDGRYLLYDTIHCLPPAHARVHLRTLATGHQVTSSRAGVPGGAVFVNGNRQVAYAGADGNLVVRRLPAFTTRLHAPPRNCRYQALAGTETRLVAALQCGTRHNLRLVAVSLRTFTVLRTLIRLGPCLASHDLSLAAGDPSAMLAETSNACQSQDTGQVRILTIRGHTVRLVRSGPRDKTPSQVLW